MNQLYTCGVSIDYMSPWYYLVVKYVDLLDLTSNKQVAYLTARLVKKVNIHAKRTANPPWTRPWVTSGREPFGTCNCVRQPLGGASEQPYFEHLVIPTDWLTGR